MRPLASAIPEFLRIDSAREATRIGSVIADYLGEVRRRGIVVGLSGGIDSSVSAALCARAIGPDNVLGLLMPERDSADESVSLGLEVARSLGVETATEDITEILEASGCYLRRDEAIRQVIPQYGPGWRSKLVFSNVVENDTFRITSLVVQSPEGEISRVRLTPVSYRQVVAATNFKQRVRKMLEYYHADRLNFAVAGTPNRLEYDQGFFVKNGDGAADIKPIAHLYKTQVYQLAEYLELPETVRSRQPTTDTFTLPQSQEEFYFSLPYEKMDICLYARNEGISAHEVAGTIGLEEAQVERVFRDIDSKRTATRYLHRRPRLVAEVPQIQG